MSVFREDQDTPRNGEINALLGIASGIDSEEIQDYAIVIMHKCTGSEDGHFHPMVMTTGPNMEAIRILLIGINLLAIEEGEN